MQPIFTPALSTQRYRWVESFLMQNKHVTSVTDVGCGNGRMVNWLKSVPNIEHINCIDSDLIILEDEMERYLRPNLLEVLFGRKNTDNAVAINVFQGDIRVPDDRLISDCFTLVEMIEHVPLDQVEAISNVVFGYYQPQYVIVTTPNAEFNPLFEQQTLPSNSNYNKPKDPNNKFRHWDHKFEWTRAQFQEWATMISNNFRYDFRLDGLGHLPGSEPYGPCTQIALFTRRTSERLPPEQTGDLTCFDLLLNKLTVEEQMHEVCGDKTKRRVCLLKEFCIPGNKHLVNEPPLRLNSSWDDDFSQTNEQSSISIQEDDYEPYYDTYENDYYGMDDCDMDDEEERINEDNQVGQQQQQPIEQTEIGADTETIWW